MNRLSGSLLILFFLPLLSAQEQAADFVWKDENGSGRQQTVWFRRSFFCDAQSSGQLHLFADSRYHLYINGVHVNFGPSRFYPANPEFDSYELDPYLVEGRNVIAVEVLSNGTVTYQVPLSKGAFIAWGEVESRAGQESLATPGAWKMMVSQAYDRDALRFSFACGPMEVFDGRKVPRGWKDRDFDDRSWEVPIKLSDQAYWGKLSPRTIPALSQDEVIPAELLGIYREQDQEERYSFFIKTPDRTNRDYNSGKQMYAATYIWSPQEQEVELGLWWGQHYINGQGPVKVIDPVPGNPVRRNRIFAFQKGWNFFFVSYVAIWGGWDFQMAVPRTAGLILSASKNKEDPHFMLTSGPHPKEPLFFNPEKDDPGDAGHILGIRAFQWQAMVNERRSSNPARDLVWRSPDLSENMKTNDFQVSHLEITEPLFLVFDMGGKKLGRFFFEVDAPEGSIMDVGWSEDLDHRSLPFLYKRLQVNAGARFTCSEGEQRYESFKPYGLRYFVLRIDPAKKPFLLKRVGLVEQVYPFLRKGSFSCSNPMLERIWEMGWRTLRVCAEDSYTDTPFRERGLYAGDALPEYAITLATSGDSRLMKKSLLLFQDMYRDNLLEGKKEGLNDFVLLTLLELDWYYRATGDRTFLEKLYPNYRSLMDHIMQDAGENGRYRSGRVFIEWTRMDKEADLTAYQALLAASFRSLSQLAAELDRREDAERYDREARRLKKLVADQYWDPQKKAYRDGFRDQQALDHHYPISSVFPLLFDLCSPGQRSAILNYLDQELKDIGEETRNRKITPYGSFYLFAALYREGRADLAERFMIQYWSRMIHQGNDTSWENFDIGGEKQGGQGTASHAWSAHPTFFLSTEVLGVQLGFTRDFDPGQVLIAPQSATLSWARGWVPHPAGMVWVEWKIRGERLDMQVQLPSGVDYRVEPRGRLAKLELDLKVKIQDSF